MKTLVRFTDRTPTKPSEFVHDKESRLDFSRYSQLNLPAADLVGAVDRLALRVQQGLRPVVTFNRVDNWCFQETTLRWSTPTAQLELEFYLSDLHGFHVWLRPYFGHDLQRTDLAFWCADRVTEPFSWNADDYGKLDVHRIVHFGQRFGEIEVTSLRFDHPVFDGIPRVEDRRKSWRRADELPELGDDIIAVTQQWIDTTLAA